MDLWPQLNSKVHSLLPSRRSQPRSMPAAWRSRLEAHGSRRDRGLGRECEAAALSPEIPATSGLAAAASLDFTNEISPGPRPCRPAFLPGRRAFEAREDTGESAALVMNKAASVPAASRIIGMGVQVGLASAEAAVGPGGEEFRRHRLWGEPSKVTHAGNTTRFTFSF